jgi:hypothetical protein
MEPVLEGPLRHTEQLSHFLDGEFFVIEEDDGFTVLMVQSADRLPHLHAPFHRRQTAVIAGAEKDRFHIVRGQLINFDREAPAHAPAPSEQDGIEPGVHGRVAAETGNMGNGVHQAILNGIFGQMLITQD